MQQNPLIKEYLDIAFRRKWWLVVPAIIGVLFAVAAFFRFDKQYQAKTRVRIVDQRIDRSVLSPIVQFDTADLVTRISSDVTSEKYVQELNDKLQLVGTPGGPRDLTELAHRLDRGIAVNSRPREDYFSLTVTWGDGRTAAAIANELAAIYIELNQEIRTTVAGETLGKLRENRVSIENRLNSVRAQIEQHRSDYRFELDAYRSLNEQRLEMIVNDLAEIDRDKRAHDGEIRNLRIRLGDPQGSLPGAEADPRVAELRNLETRRAELRGRGYGEAHPEIAALDRQIRALRETLGSGTDTPDEAPRLSVQQQQIQEEIRRHEEEITALNEQRQDLVGESETIQGRLDRTPVRENALARLLQEAENLQTLYDDAYGKEMDAQGGVDLEAFQAGERFQVLNEARPPKEPIFPDLRLFLAMGFAVGLGAGVSIILLLEVFDQSFKSEEQLAASIDYPILAVIPDLNKAADRARTKRNKPKVRGRRAS